VHACVYLAAGYEHVWPFSASPSRRQVRCLSRFFYLLPTHTSFFNSCFTKG
jgi:hypothetical protein